MALKLPHIQLRGVPIVFTHNKVWSLTLGAGVSHTGAVTYPNYF